MHLLNDDIFKRAVGGKDDLAVDTPKIKQKRKRRNRWYNTAYRNIKTLQSAYLSEDKSPITNHEPEIQPALQVALGYQNLMCFSISNPSGKDKCDFYCSLDTGASHSVISGESVRLNPILKVATV